MSTVSVSIIIPLYNKTEFIRRALDSVLNQTFQDYEVIVVDDGSTDNGPVVIKTEYDDPRIKLVTQSNAGPGAARNRGVKEARGELVTFLDADDEWLPIFLEKSINNIENNHSCVASTCSFYINDFESLSKINTLANISPGPFRVSGNETPKQLSYINGIMHSAGTVLCKTAVCRKYGGFFEGRCMYGEDRFLWLKVLLNSYIYYDDTPMFKYYSNNSQLAPYDRNRDFWPAVLYPEEIRSICPSSLTSLLDKYLAFMALKECHNYFSIKKITEIKYVISKHPTMLRVNFLSYIFLIAKVKVPYLVELWRKRY